jgi:hypothetical protein
VVLRPVIAERSGAGLKRGQGVGAHMTYLVRDAGAPPAVGPEEPVSADYVEVALDASCAALMALDLVRTLAADDERVTGRISLAIAALRHAIADLREQQAEGASAASNGFVCGPPEPAGAPGQLPGSALAGR